MRYFIIWKNGPEVNSMAQLVRRHATPPTSLRGSLSLEAIQVLTMAYMLHLWISMVYLASHWCHCKCKSHESSIQTFSNFHSGRWNSTDYANCISTHTQMLHVRNIYQKKNLKITQMEPTGHIFEHEMLNGGWKQITGTLWAPRMTLGT